MTTRFIPSGRLPRALAAASLALAAALLLLVLLFDWNWLRRPIETAVSARTGRTLVLAGGIEGHWTWDRPRSWLPVPTITLLGARLANPSWAEQPSMVDAERITVTVPLTALLRRGPVIDELVLVGATVGLETGPEGKRSWRLDKAQADPEATVSFRRIIIERGVVRYLDRPEATDITARVSDRAQGTTRIDVSGRARGAPLKLAITTVDAAEALAASGVTSASPAFHGKGQVGDAAVSFDGRLGPGYALAGSEADLKASGPDLSTFRRLARAAVPATPPYRIDAHLKLLDNGVDVVVRTSTFGDSRLQGTLAVQTGGARTRVAGTFTATPLDLDDLAPLFGAAPGIRAGETASPAQRKTAAAAADRGKVLPDMPFETSFWSNVDMDITLDARKVNDSGRMAIDAFMFRARMTDGQLEVSPLSISIAGGKVDGGFTLTRNADAVQMKSTLRFARLQLGRLAPQSSKITASLGEISGAVDLSGRGKSVGAMLAGSNGRVALAMGSGNVSNLLIELVGLDGGEALAFLIRGDRVTRLRCAVASLPIEDGQVNAEAVVFDTVDTNIVVTGSASLRNETLDFTLHPTPKDWSLFAVRSPIHLRGTFYKPSVAVDAAALGARLGSAVLLGLLNPLAALIPLVETGGGEDADCRGLLSDVRAAAAKKPSPGAPAPRTPRSTAPAPAGPPR